MECLEDQIDAIRKVKETAIMEQRFNDAAEARDTERKLHRQLLPHVYKLIRDHIAEQAPDRMETFTIPEAEYRVALHAKLLEEAGELAAEQFGSDAWLSELGDVLDVIDAMVELNYGNVSYNEVNQLRLAKTAKRGGFENRVGLVLHP